MRNLKVIILLIFVFSASNMIGQKSNAEKILGCWIFDKVEFASENDYSEILLKQAKNSVVCFTPNGKFNTSINGVDPVSGTYSISADGKTMTQKRDSSGEENLIELEMEAEIQSLDDAVLVFSTEFGIMHFKRK